MTDLTTEVSPYTKEANTSLFKEKRDGKKRQRHRERSLASLQSENTFDGKITQKEHKEVGKKNSWGKLAKGPLCCPNTSSQISLFSRVL